MENIKVSKQAQIVIDNLKDFNLEDCKKWYREVQYNCIGDKDVFAYLYYKKIIEEKIKKCQQVQM